MSAVKKAVKKIGKLVKKIWKPVLIASAVVFTAGLAAAGTGAFAATVGSKGLLVAVGSTLKTGVIAIGGTLGIGKGVVAGSSALAGNSAAILANSAAGVGTTLANGAAAQALGFGKLAAGASQASGSTIAGGVGGATTQPLGSGITSAYGTGMSTAAGAPTSFAAANGVTGAAAPFAGAQQAAAANVLGTSPMTSVSAWGSGTAGALVPATETATKAGGFMNSAVGSALVSGGLNAVSSYMAAKGAEDDEAINALYGVSPRKGDTSLTPEQIRFSTPMETRNSWRPRLMYDA